MPFNIREIFTNVIQALQMQFYWLQASQTNAASSSVQLKQYSCSGMWDNKMAVCLHMFSQACQGSLVGFAGVGLDRACLTAFLTSNLLPQVPYLSAVNPVVNGFI